MITPEVSDNTHSRIRYDRIGYDMIGWDQMTHTGQPGTARDSRGQLGTARDGQGQEPGGVVAGGGGGKGCYVRDGDGGEANVT